MLPLDIGRYTLFLITGSLAAILPGPSILYVVSQSFSGLKKALPSILGLLTGTFILGLLIVIGHGPLLNTLYKFAFFVKIFTCIGLAILGIKRFFLKEKLTFVESRTRNSTAKKDYSIGLVTTLTSPKVILFYLLVIPQFINPAYSEIYQLSILAITQFIIKVLALIGYALISKQIIIIFNKNGNMRMFNKISGGLLVIAALILFFIY